MSLSRLVITADLVATMRRDGVILVLTRSKGVPGLLIWCGLAGVFIIGAVLLFDAGVHGIGPVVGAVTVIVGYPIVCVRTARRAVHRAVQPYDVGGAVASSASPGRLVLRDPDTGYETRYRTRKVRFRGSTAAVEVTLDKKRGLILVPKALLSPDDVVLLTHRV